MVLFLQAYKEYQLSESDFLCAFSWAVCKYLSNRELAKKIDPNFKRKLESIAYEATTTLKNHELNLSRGLLKECLADERSNFTRDLESYLETSVHIMKSLTFKYEKML